MFVFNIKEILEEKSYKIVFNTNGQSHTNQFLKWPNCYLKISAKLIIYLNYLITHATFRVLVCFRAPKLNMYIVMQMFMFVFGSEKNNLKRNEAKIRLFSFVK